MSGGLRYNEGKRRIDLIDVEALNGLADVLTLGARKYAERNWELGMPWSKVYSSLMRHCLAFWNGEDVDHESGLPHVDHIACNAMFLQAYYRRNRDLDDRPRQKVQPQEVGRAGKEGEETTPQPTRESTAGLIQTISQWEPNRQAAVKKVLWGGPSASGDSPDGYR